jgi:glycerophosphoryl diester phosphodiesterase
MDFSRADRPLIWGHRGASSVAPENTLASFLLAEEQGADGVELDAQRCGSGEVVVLHDESLGRTTGFAGLIGETPWSVVRKLDAGSRKDPRFKGEPIPLLEEVLARVKIAVNIELKCDRMDDRGLTAEVVRLVHEARAEDRVLLSSFNPLCLLKARLLAPKLPRALLFEKAQEWPLRSALSAPALDPVLLHPEDVLATPDRVSGWRKRGYLIGCWTVDDPAEATRLWQSGVSGIITNRPSDLLQHFKT